jgi:hypothetical protein
MSPSYAKNNNKQNNQNRLNSQNKQNSQCNQRNEGKEQSNKKVPMKYQPQNSKDAGSVEFKYEIDGVTERTKMSVYEDGNDKEYIKMINKITLKHSKFGRMKTPLISFTATSEGAFQEQPRIFGIK